MFWIPTVINTKNMQRCWIHTSPLNRNTFSQKIVTWISIDYIVTYFSFSQTVFLFCNTFHSRLSSGNLWLFPFRWPWLHDLDFTMSLKLQQWHTSWHLSNPWMYLWELLVWWKLSACLHYSLSFSIQILESADTQFPWSLDPHG